MEAVVEVQVQVDSQYWMLKLWNLPEFLASWKLLRLSFLCQWMWSCSRILSWSLSLKYSMLHCLHHELHNSMAFGWWSFLLHLLSQ